MASKPSVRIVAGNDKFNQYRLSSLDSLLHSESHLNEYIAFAKLIEQHWWKLNSDAYREEHNVFFNSFAISDINRYGPSQAIQHALRDALYSECYDPLELFMEDKDKRQIVNAHRLAWAWYGNEERIVGHVVIQTEPKAKPYEASMKSVILPDQRNLGFAAKILPLALAEIENLEQAEISKHTTLDVCINGSDKRSIKLMNGLMEGDLVKKLEKSDIVSQRRKAERDHVFRAKIDNKAAIEKALEHPPAPSPWAPRTIP